MDILSNLNWGMFEVLAGLGLGYWLRGQNMASIQADVTSIKNEIEKIKNLFTPAPAPVAAPVATVAN
jgi:hypothetical protein